MSTCHQCGVTFSAKGDGCKSASEIAACRNYKLFGKREMDENVKHRPEVRHEAEQHPKEDVFDIGPHLEETPEQSEAQRALVAIKRKDNVRRPHHYTRWKHEPVKFLVENGVNPTQFNVVKYVMRYEFKNGAEDLKKARRYLDMEIKRLEGDPNWSE